MIVTLGIVAGLTILNLLVNVVAQLRGLGFPYNDFLYRPNDNFADFFSLLASYPNGGGAAYPTDHAGLHSLIPVDPPSIQTLRAPGGRERHAFPHDAVGDLMRPNSASAAPFIDPVALFFFSSPAFRRLVAGSPGILVPTPFNAARGPCSAFSPIRR